MNEAVQKFDTTVSGYLSYIDQNEYVTAALSLFLILYAAYAAPKLPPYILKLFDNLLVKLLVFFLIVYTARKNPTVAIIAAVGFMVTVQALTRFKVDQAISSLVGRAEAEQRRKEEGMATLTELRNEPAPHVSLEEHILSEVSVPEGEIVGIKEEVKGKPVAESTPQTLEPCVKNSKYRNSFYPQYVNMNADAYDARNLSQDVGGFDPESGYASL